MNSNRMCYRIHLLALRWLDIVLREAKNERVYFDEELAFAAYYRELQATGIFQDGINLKEDPVRKFFSEEPWWTDLDVFTHIINNEIQDYKLVAHVILIAMRRVRSRILHKKLRDFFIVAFKRLIVLTEQGAADDVSPNGAETVL